jgi:hypothetical protein
MSTEGQTLDQLVEQPAIGLFAEIAWATSKCRRGRETKGEVASVEGPKK